MPTYCEREDVLRELGGDQPTIQKRFDLRKWEGGEPLESVTVDGLTFDMPTSIMLRIDVQISFASSRLNTAILNAYKAEPASIPPHVTKAAASIAAFEMVTTDGVRTEYMRAANTDALTYFDKIAKWELDLGIVAPRPVHRTPAVFLAQGVGGGGSQRHRHGRHHHRGGCGC